MHYRSRLPASWIAVALAASASAGPVPDMTVARGTHPRIVCTPAGLAAMRALRTPEASNILQRIRGLSVVELEQRDQLKEAGYQAAGLVGVGAVFGDEGDSAKGKAMLTRKIMEFPLDGRLSLMEKSGRIMGASMAFDFGYASWNEAYREQTGRKLLAKAKDMLAPLAGKGQTDNVLCAVAHCAAGVCAMALIDEPYAEAEARELLATADGAIRAYLKASLTEKGVDTHGEGLKQVFFASGLLPYMHAWKNMFGAWPDYRPSVLAGLRAVAHQTVSGCGTFRFENAGGAIDRSGLCAMGIGIADDETRDALMWLYGESVGAGSYDVTRPVHGFYMLQHDVAAVESARNSDAERSLPLLFQDDAAGLVSFRNTWGRKDAIGLAVTLHAGTSGKGGTHAGDFRIYGLGGRWASLFGAHADKYGPAEGRILNTAGFVHEKVSMFEPGGTSLQLEGRYTTIESSGKTMVLAIERKGKVTMKRVTVTKEPPSRKTEIVAEGECTVLRSVAADYTGLCGAPGLFVVVDRIAGPEAVPTGWCMHTDAAFTLVEEGRARVKRKEEEMLRELDEQVKSGAVKFAEKQQKLAEIAKTVGELLDAAVKNAPYDNRCVLRKTADDGTTFAMTLVAGPDPLAWTVSPMGHLWNEVIARGGRDYMVVMTLQKGDAPAVKVAGSGLAAVVTVGNRKISFDGRKVVLGE